MVAVKQKSKAAVPPKMAAVMDAINKKYGTGTMNRASRVSFAHYVRIPTGIFNLDMDIGGGVPKGRFILVTGYESVGKTTLCLLMAAKFQHTCKKCLTEFEGYTDEKVDATTGEVVNEEYVLVRSCKCGENEGHNVCYFDAEGTFDPVWAAALGVDVARLFLIQPEYAEQGCDAANALIRTGELDALFIDSVANYTPSREVEESAQSGQRPDLALIMNRFMRTLQSGLNSLGMDNRNKPLIVLVNQKRQKIGVMYGDDSTLPGGHGQKFAASIRIDMRAGQKVDRKGNVGGKDPVKVGVELHYDVSKNKTFPPYKKGSFILFTADAPNLGRRKGEINNFEQIIAYGTSLGIIERSGAWYDLQGNFGSEYANPKSGSGKFQGEEALIEFLKEDPDKAQQVRDRILQVVKNQNTGVPVSGDDEDEE